VPLLTRLNQKRMQLALCVLPKTLLLMAAKLSFGVMRFRLIAASICRQGMALLER